MQCLGTSNGQTSANRILKSYNTEISSSVRVHFSTVTKSVISSDTVISHDKITLKWHSSNLVYRVYLLLDRLILSGDVHLRFYSSSMDGVEWCCIKINWRIMKPYLGSYAELLSLLLHQAHICYLLHPKYLNKKLQPKVSHK